MSTHRHEIDALDTIIVLSVILGQSLDKCSLCTCQDGSVDIVQSLSLASTSVYFHFYYRYRVIECTFNFYGIYCSHVHIEKTFRRKNLI